MSRPTPTSGSGEAPTRKTTIHHLPPEIVSQIIDDVEDLANAEADRRGGVFLGPPGLGLGFGPDGQPIDLADDEDFGGFVAAIVQGLVAAPPGAGPRAGAGAGAGAGGGGDGPAPNAPDGLAYGIEGLFGPQGPVGPNNPFNPFENVDMRGGQWYGLGQAQGAGRGGGLAGANGVLGPGPAPRAGAGQGRLPAGAIPLPFAGELGGALAGADFMPNGAGGAGGHPGGPAAPRADDPDEEDEGTDDMPPLEHAANPAATVPANTTADAADAADASDGDDGDPNWVDDEEEGDMDEDDEDHDADEPEEGESDCDDEGMYPDGLPTDPVLPLLFVNNAFLHEGRNKLYKIVILTTLYQLHLFHRSLTAPAQAARGTVERAEVDERGLASNGLGVIVRQLNLLYPHDMSGSRGAADLFFEVLHRTPHLKDLVVTATFLKSSIKKFLTALGSLKELSKVELISGLDQTRPLLLTVPRIIKLLEEDWLELDELVVASLESGSAGPLAEAEQMWAHLGDLHGGHEDSSAEDPDADSMSIEPAMLATSTEAFPKAQLKPKPKGITRICLDKPNAPGPEIELLLRHSRGKLERLALIHPTRALSRFGLCSLLLNFGANLTDLVIEVTPAWPVNSRRTVLREFPKLSKPAKDGRQTDAAISAVAGYVYLLDAALEHLPNLEYLKFDGPLASTSVFSHFPSSLGTVRWSHCPAIQPKVLAALLKKTVTRTKMVTQPDGSKSQRTHRTKVAKGLKCITVDRDDMSWSEADLFALEAAVVERDVCLHLSDGQNHNPHNPVQRERGRGPGAGPGPGPGPGAGAGAGAGVGAGAVAGPPGGRAHGVGLGPGLMPGPPPGFPFAIGGRRNGPGGGMFGMGPGAGGMDGGAGAGGDGGVGGGGIRFNLNLAIPPFAPGPPGPAPRPPPAPAPAPGPAHGPGFFAGLIGGGRRLPGERTAAAAGEAESSGEEDEEEGEEEQGQEEAGPAGRPRPRGGLLRGFFNRTRN